jgi:hypothetical protein
MFKPVVRSLILICAGAVAAIGVLKALGYRPPDPTTASAVPTIEQVRDLSELVTTSVDVADVQLTDLRGWTGGVRVAMLVRGQYWLSTDLSQARFESVDAPNKTAVLVLPPPRATSPRLDHECTKLFAVSPYGVWQIVPSNRAEIAAVNAAMAQAQVSITAAANCGALDAAARGKAEAVVWWFSGAIYWNVTIRWSDPPLGGGPADRALVVHCS